MKILFIGQKQLGTRSLQRYNAMVALTHSLYSISIDYSLSLALNKVINLSYKLGYPLDPMKVNKSIIQLIKTHKFDCIWVDKALMLKPSTLKTIRKRQKNIKIILYTEDNLFLKHNQSKYFLKCLKFYDIFVTTKSENLDSNAPMKSEIKRLYFVNNTFDKRSHLPPEKIDNIKYRNDVVFIGTYEKKRAETIRYLAYNGVNVTVWGGGWKAFSHENHPNLTIKTKTLVGKDYVDEIFHSKISLCFLREINRDLQTARTIEIPACGGAMLAQDTIEHRKLFRNNLEAAYFNSNEELLDKVMFYLNNEKERLSMARKGRQRCLNSGYSHDKMIETVLNLL